jgi:hypothetical protein
MRQRLAIVFTVIGAIALPVVMAATVLYASDAAIGGSDEPLTPQFGTTAPATTTTPQTHQDQGGQTGGGSSTGGGGSNSGSGSSGSGGGDGSGGGGHGGDD